MDKLLSVTIGRFYPNFCSQKITVLTYLGYAYCITKINIIKQFKIQFHAFVYRQCLQKSLCVALTFSQYVSICLIPAYNMLAKY